MNNLIMRKEQKYQTNSKYFAHLNSNRQVATYFIQLDDHVIVNNSTTLLNHYA